MFPIQILIQRNSLLGGFELGKTCLKFRSLIDEKHLVNTKAKLAVLGLHDLNTDPCLWPVLPHKFYTFWKKCCNFDLWLESLAQLKLKFKSRGKSPIACVRGPQDKFVLFQSLLLVLVIQLRFSHLASFKSVWFQLIPLNVVLVFF